jgi:drug/metabolite transporter (DMT)-like permease
MMFLTLSLIWGSSFLLIKTGLRELDAFSLVAGRLAVAALCFGALFAVQFKRLRFPRDLNTWLGIGWVGIINTALPFLLITWGETSIDSGLAGVLNGTVPLFSLVIAHFLTTDDRINAAKLIGLTTGFVGVVILATRTMDGTTTNSIEGQLAVLLAAIFYAVGAVFVRRRLRHVDSSIIAGGSMIVAAALVVPITLVTVRPLPVLPALSADVVLAVLALGAVNTFIAYLMLYRLIKVWGASRATMVTYLISPVSLAIGVIFGRESADIRLILGAALVLGGVVVVNLWRQGSPPQAQVAQPATSKP